MGWVTRGSLRGWIERVGWQNRLIGCVERADRVCYEIGHLEVC